MEKEHYFLPGHGAGNPDGAILSVPSLVAVQGASGLHPVNLPGSRS